MTRKIRQIVLWALIGLGLYIMAAGVLPYVWKRRLPADWQEGVDPAAYYARAGETGVDRVALIETPQQSLEVRLQLIARAQRRLDIAYYAVKLGESTDQLLAALLEAADRGVQVRLLLDGLASHWGGAGEELARALASHPNIELRWYNPVSVFKPWTYNGRMHDKYILVDDRLLLLGGRNVGDMYFGAAGYDGALTLDRDVLVFNTAFDRPGERESVLFAVEGYMQSVWDSPSCRPAPDRPTDGSRAQQARLRQLAEGLRRAHPAWWQAQPAQADWERTVATGRVSLITNDITIGPKAPRVGYVLDQLLLGARERVVLQSPYLVPDSALWNLLNGLGERGIACDILTNSTATSPNFPAFSVYLSARREIVGTGARVYEYQGPDSLHAKSYVVDGRLSLVGSYNLDPRSRYIDTEMMLVIDSVPFSQTLLETMDGYRQRALLVEEDGQYAPADLPPAPVPWLKRVGMLAASVPFRLFRFLV